MKHDDENYEKNTHTFVIKIWLEEIIGKYKFYHWRGHIMHIPSGERKYFDKLSKVTQIITGYLFQFNSENTSLTDKFKLFLWKMFH
jgi:hypothetical protein